MHPAAELAVSTELLQAFNYKLDSVYSFIGELQASDVSHLAVIMVMCGLAWAASFVVVAQTRFHPEPELVAHPGTPATTAGLGLGSGGSRSNVDGRTGH